jgi:aspartate aminotransferase
MTPFDPARLVSPRAAHSDEGAIIRMSQKARELKASGRDVVMLTLGEPDFDTPAHIQAAATAAMKSGFTHYSPVAGTPELRAALAKKLKDENGLGYSAAEIVTANGAKQAIANALFALIEPGDEVILLSPFWVSYEISVKLAGGKPVILHATVDENFKVPAHRIEAAISARTKLIFLNSPNNPTGAVWTRAELEALARIVEHHDRLMVVSDEIYEYIVFDGEMLSFGSLPGMLGRTITVNGFSKSFAMTGWRLGYAAAPEPIARAMARMQSAISAGANSFVQRAAVVALQSSRQCVDDMRERYRARRDRVASVLSQTSALKLASIPATFYAFPDAGACLGRKAGNHVMDSVETLCDWLVEEHGVATVPGTAFGDPRCFRISFAVSDSDLEVGLTRIAGALARLS